MNEKFFDLKTEKQDRMINASLKIFSVNGYQYASTDDIVKEAGISKGLLFHYFGSKLGLYSFLTDYCVRYIKMEITNIKNDKETDYFVILKDIETAKLSALKKFPYMQQFLIMMEREDSPDAMKATAENRTNLKALYQEIMKKADLSKFRAEANSLRIMKMVDIMLKSLMYEEIKTGAFKPDHYHTEAVSYLDMISSLVNKN
ncbi:MAG: TetR/AcrR family transcriptional regulator [Lachnospiraceae bacterium]|nr:TetR/AcrR family transcriptional regulator [Lachnospiraceae bacterium]